ncbi:D-alanyl-D-alanine carboxypeptidase [Aliamphritea spongicola]|uniref:D-alanyl-D-alanine carboxypeptidase n=1 Tax=Aliamphritea spongicola TaxID=707589 RepID=UPI00196B156B|nr:D-alanyl-D-alanine carboxypeptidase [Aliamphritea spongicola]MBN3561065.1 D-alanyl-D-alanine carboxypeptidase [Aliamphritea spongicola]
MQHWLKKLCFTASVLFSSLAFAQQPNPVLADHFSRLKPIKKVALLVQNQDEDWALRADKSLVPASTLKIVLASLAIKRWGLGHRFTTEFYREGNVLWVKGLGDPFLTSEEIELIKIQLGARTDLTTVTEIRLDNSFFPELRLDGRNKSDNPYDAGNAALAINFNTAAVRYRKGKLLPGEAQTPLTPLAVDLADDIPTDKQNGERRIALPGGRDMSARYFGEVFSALMFNRQLPLQIMPVSASAKAVYTHRSSRTLEDLLLAMLKYSNNFIANQLFLLLPGREVSISASQKYVMAQLEAEYGWQDFNVSDGAGLSRQNRLSARQLMAVLESFRPWAYLLPARGERIQAKTGTFWDNHSYAGYYLDEQQEWQAFVLLINTTMKAGYRFRFADALIR